ncbi:MAG: cupredoxin family copper-binding protein [Chloroflexota bacterium]|nr:cupredoxin family copper-binding protein [Chloroflexota bacterium]
MTHQSRWLTLLAASVMVVALILALAPAGSTTLLHDDATPAPATPGPDGTPLATPDVNEIVIAMESFEFNPEFVTIPVDTSIVWTNRDSVAHTADASDDPQTFDSGNIAPGERYSHSFDTPGTFPYVCIYHGNMRGTIVVELRRRQDRHLA